MCRAFEAPRWWSACSFHRGGSPRASRFIPNDRSHICRSEQGTDHISVVFHCKMISSELRRRYLVIWLMQLIVSSFARSTQYPSEGSGSDTSTIKTLFPRNNSFLHVSSIQSSSRGASAIPQCDSLTYGINLDRGSCFDAWPNMGWDDEHLRWGQRGSTNSPISYSLIVGVAVGIWKHPAGSVQLACDHTIY